MNSTKTAALLALIAITIVMSNCRKNGPENDENEVPGTSDTTMALHRDVRIIDSTKFILSNDTNLLKQGDYEFTHSENLITIKAGDIIVGSTGEGYIRRVRSVVAQGNKVTFKTEPAALDEVFSQGKFSYEFDLSELIPNNKKLPKQPDAEKGIDQDEKVMNSVDLPIQEKILYNEGGAIIKLNQGMVNLDATWKFDHEFSAGSLSYLLAACEDAGIKATADFEVILEKNVNLPAIKGSLAKYKKIYPRVVFVGVVPVPLITTITIDLQYNVYGSANAKISRSLHTEAASTVDFGIKYEKGSISPIYDGKLEGSVRAGGKESLANGTLNMSISPVITVTLNGMVGINASLALMEELKVAGSDKPETGTVWDISAAAWLQTNIGAHAGVFGKKLVETSKTWDTERLIYSTPVKIEKVSGDEQDGIKDKQLQKPLVVKVNDIVLSPQGGVNVNFRVKSGGGTLSSKFVMTDPQGLAEVNWILGNKEEEDQLVEAVLRKGDGSMIGIVTFQAKLQGNDTVNMIINHGTWKAFAGTDDDGGIFNDSAYYTNEYPRCKMTTYHWDIQDSLHITFKADGTGIFQRWQVDWGTEITDEFNCKLTNYSRPDYATVSFNWRYNSQTKSIDVKFPVDFWEIPTGKEVVFSILSIRKDRLHLHTDADPDVEEDFDYQFQ
ncbi:hypothetical protein [Flavitalea sp.]|nr:hypothetical protein [Flavitalea sp.]